VARRFEPCQRSEQSSAPGGRAGPTPAARIPELAGHLRGYRDAWREAGHPGTGDVCLRIPVYAAPTEQAAMDEPHDTITYYFRRQAELTRAPIGRAGTGPVERLRAQAERLSSLTYGEILATKVAFGSGPGLVDRLRTLKDELGVERDRRRAQPRRPPVAGAGNAQSPHPHA
jgi:hypothetical protein